MDEKNPEVEYELANPATSTWTVSVEGAVIGTLYRVDAWLSNQTKPRHWSGGFRGKHWKVTVDGADLEPDDARDVRWKLTRQKTNREHAARYLIAAYGEAGVAFPPAPEDAEERRAA